MLYKNLCLIALLANIVRASSTVNPGILEPMFVDGGMAHSKNLLEELLVYSNKVNDEFDKMEEVYKLSVEAFTKQYNMSFSAQEETFVFEARIPQNFNRCDVYIMILDIVAEYMPKNNNDKTFPNHVFSKSTVALAESCISALNLLIDFANTKLSNRNRYAPRNSLKRCSIAYDPEEPYDANLILTINWLIELIGNSYRCTYLYNYEICIKEEDQALVYKVVFSEGPSYSACNVPTYDFVPEFHEYCQVLSQLDFKELSEGETTKKFLEWAKDGYKLELVKCINENKEFYINVFDVIRKYRANEIEIYYFTHPGLSAPHNSRSINTIYCLTPEEEKLMKDLSIYPVKNTIIKPFIDLSFLHSPDELTKDIKYKASIEREIMLALFAQNCTSSYYTKKIYSRLIEAFQKHKDIMKEEEFKPRYNKNDRCRIWDHIETFDVTRLSDLNNIPSDTLESTISKLYRMSFKPKELLQRLAEITRKYETSDTKKDANSLQLHQKEKEFTTFEERLHSDIYKIRHPLYTVLFGTTGGIPELIKLEEELEAKKLRFKEIRNYKSDFYSKNDGRLVIQKDIKKLKNEILKRKQYLHRVRNDIFLASKHLWKSLYEFLVELNRY